MSSESALPVAIPNVAQGVDVSARSLCCLWLSKEEKALAHLWWYLLEAAGFDLQLLFLFFSPKDGGSIAPSAWTCFCAGLVPTLA